MNIVQLNTVNLGGDIIVKKSDGGSESGGGGSNIEYWDMSGFPAEMESLSLMSSILLKYSTEYGTVIMTPFLAQNITLEKQFKAVMIDITIQIVELGRIGTIKDLLIAQGFTEADFDTIPRISKEEFYNLD